MITATVPRLCGWRRPQPHHGSGRALPGGLRAAGASGGTDRLARQLMELPDRAVDADARRRLRLGVGAEVALSAAALLAGLRVGVRGDPRHGPCRHADRRRRPISWRWSNQRGGFPRVNDVTTDFADAPSLVFSGPRARPKRAILPRMPPPSSPACSSRPIPTSSRRCWDAAGGGFRQGLGAGQGKGWTIVETDPGAGVIDAYDRSFWFGFAIDIAIRVVPDGGNGRVDMRSSARQDAAITGSMPAACGPSWRR